MEQFDIPHQRVKEKNMYMLNLDAPRIVLIVAAVIGIVVVSFLLGMNFIRGGEGAKTLLTKNDIFDSQKELDLLKTTIPPAPDEDELSKPLDDSLGALEKEDRGAVIKGDPDAAGAEKHARDDLAAIDGNESSNTLTSDNVSQTVAVRKPAVKKSSRLDDDEKQLSRSDDVEPSLKHVRKATVRGDVKKKKSGRSKVVAVSGDRMEYSKVNGSGGYTIQVASLDNKSRAQTEVRSLREMSYDAYLDDTQVNGKRFYRVRIGPVASRKKALDLLNDFQGKDRYRESYMVRE